MNKRKKEIIIVGMILMIFCAIPVYGQTSQAIGDDDAQQQFELVLATDSNAVRGQQTVGVLRGLLIASGAVQISDEGRGVLGVYAETLCHTYVDQIDMRIYLDILVPDTADEEEYWYTLNYYDQGWTKEDTLNEELYAVSVSFDINGLERGRYYRLRCSHYVYSGDSFEARNSQTAFIPLG